MNKNLIFVPFAYDLQKKTGANIRGADKKRALIKNVYLKNCCVALISAKRLNENDDVAFVTNLVESEIPNEYRSLLKENGILIWHIPFRTFVFPSDFLWGLAFYKLCALKELAETKCEEYQNLCCLDSDVYVSRSFNSIWQECSQHILLYDALLGLNDENYARLLKEVNDLYENKGIITHYGGEFFASNMENSQKFISECEAVYRDAKEKKIKISCGDEFITSIAAESLKMLVRNAGAYCRRYWTGSYYRSSQAYKDGIIWHVPAEKQRGMLKLYSKYISKGKIPKRDNVARILHLNHQCFFDKVKNIIKIFLKRA